MRDDFTHCLLSFPSRFTRILPTSSSNVFLKSRGKTVCAGLMLVSVGGKSVVGKDYEKVIETLRKAGRPVTCVFNDPPRD